MQNDLPDIQIFTYISEGDYFVEHEDYQDIAPDLGLVEWNAMVWIGRLFSLDNDFGEHWMDNFELIEQKQATLKETKRQLPMQPIYVIDPDRMKDGKDGPCHQAEFRKQFWTDVLRNLKINLGTLIDKARQVNKTEGKNPEDNPLPNLERNIIEIVKRYAPESPLIQAYYESQLGIDPKLIAEIAGTISMGMLCYVDKKTQELGFIPDMDKYYGVDTEEWEEDIEKFTTNPDAYWRFEQMSSREAFKIMEDFADQLDNDRLRNRLSRVLNKRKPFQNFKYEIDNSGEYRQQWFDFRQKRDEAYVRELMEMQMNQS